MQEEQREELDNFYTAVEAVEGENNENEDKEGEGLAERTYKHYNSEIADLTGLATGKNRFLGVYLNNGPWYRNLPEELVDLKRKLKEMTQNEIFIKRKETKQAYNKLIEQFEARLGKNNEEKWMRDMFKMGTFSNRMSVSALMILSAPLFRLSRMDKIEQFCKKKRRETVQATKVLKDIFLQLLPDRKLLWFHQQPLAHPHAEMEHFIFWEFEHQLKDRYDKFIKYLRHRAFDEMIDFRVSTLGVVHHLLSNREEQEMQLLDILITKLSDSNKTVSSTADRLLTRLLSKHTNMKLSVIKAVASHLMSLKNTLDHLQRYYALVFLNSIILANGEVVVARTLIEVYLKTFVHMQSSNNGLTEKKMVEPIITGIKRAEPYARLRDAGAYDEHIDTLFRLAHTVDLRHGIMVLHVLYSIAMNDTEIRGRYFTALYARMLSPEVWVNDNLSLYLNVVYKSLRRDTSVVRIIAFIRRLLQCCYYQKPNTLLAVLMLISRLLKSKREVKDFLIRHDVFFTRKFGKGKKPSKKQAKKPANNDEEVDSDVEEMSDVSDDEEEQRERKDFRDGKKNKFGRKRTREERDELREEVYDKDNSLPYDPMQRNPLYCSPVSRIYELSALTRHFHPKVAEWAQTLLLGKSIYFRANPMDEFAMEEFTKRFLYKPSGGTGKNETDKDLSKIKQTFERQKSVQKKVAVNSKGFLRRKAASQEKFFQQFFETKSALLRMQKRRKKGQNVTEMGEAEEIITNVDSDDESDVDKFLDAEMAKKFGNDLPEISDGEEQLSSGDEDDFEEIEEFDAITETGREIVFDEDALEFKDEQEVDEMFALYNADEEVPDLDDGEDPLTKPMQGGDDERNLFLAADDLAALLDDTDDTYRPKRKKRRRK